MTCGNCNNGSSILSTILITMTGICMIYYTFQSARRKSDKKRVNMANVKNIIKELDDIEIKLSCRLVYRFIKTKVLDYCKLKHSNYILNYTVMHWNLQLYIYSAYNITWSLYFISLMTNIDKIIYNQPIIISRIVTMMSYLLICKYIHILLVVIIYNRINYITLYKRGQKWRNNKLYFTRGLWCN